jgi:hypothetical protein
LYLRGKLGNKLGTCIISEEDVIAYDLGLKDLPELDDNTLRHKRTGIVFDFFKNKEK